MNKLVIGLDIGTQFCYAGYLIKDGKGGFKSKFKPAFDAENNKLGIPSLIIVDKDNPKNLYAGIEAYDLLKSHPDKYVSMSESFKTFVLNNCDIDSKIYPFDDLDEAYKVKEILNVLMSALNATIKKYLDNDSNLSDGYNIEEIHFACPNLSQKDDINDESTLNKYIETLRHVIECAFGSTVDISVHLEGLFGIELVTALLGKKSNEYTNIITIDIGAGTTDNAISVNSTAHESSKKNDMDVICLNSAYFGAQNIDEIIVNSANNIKGGNNYDYLKKNPYAICNIKKWLFESGNVDDKIDSRLEENKSYLKSAVINEMNIMDNFRNYEHMIDNISQKLCKIKNDNSSFLVVLLGGTSRISFLKDEIENNFKKKHLKFKIKYLYELVDETHHQDINDANFMAYAAAHNNTYPKCFSRSAPKAKIETKFISVIQRVGAPNIIAVKLVGGNYAIIASPDPEGNPYFLTKDAYRSVNVREEDDKEVKTYPPTFDLKSVLYYFSTNETIPDDTTELKPFSEKSSMYTCIPSKTNITCLTRHNLTSYIGEKKKLPRNNVICRYIGSFYNYDPSISLDKALEIMTYNNDTLKGNYGNIPIEHQLKYDELRDKINQINQNKIKEKQFDVNRNNQSTPYNISVSLAVLFAVICLCAGIPIYISGYKLPGTIIFCIFTTAFLLIGGYAIYLRFSHKTDKVN